MLEDLSTLEALALIAAVAVVMFQIGRMSASGESPMDRDARRMQERLNAEEQFNALQPEVQEQIDALVQAGKVIEAVKVIREATGLGLRDAKLIVDARAAQLKG